MICCHASNTTLLSGKGTWASIYLHSWTRAFFRLRVFPNFSKSHFTWIFCSWSHCRMLWESIAVSESCEMPISTAWLAGCLAQGSNLPAFKTPGWLAFNQGAVPHRPHSGTVRPEMRGSLLVSWQFIFSIHFFSCLTFLAQLTERPSLLNDLVPVTWALTLKTTATSLRCTHHAASVSVLVHLRYQRWLQCKFSPQKWLMSSLQEKNILGSLVQF